MRKSVYVILSVLIAGIASARPKLIEIPEGYEHDKWNTAPDDAIRKFGAFTSSFDTDDDDTGDGVKDLWGIPQWVAYHMKAFRGSPNTENRPAWFTDNGLKNQGFAPTDDTYKYSKAFRKAHPIRPRPPLHEAARCKDQPRGRMEHPYDAERCAPAPGVQCRYLAGYRVQPDRADRSEAYGRRRNGAR